MALKIKGVYVNPIKRDKQILRKVGLLKHKKKKTKKHVGKKNAVAAVTRRHRARLR